MTDREARSASSRPIGRLLLGLALVAAGGAGWRASPAPDRPPARLLGGNVPLEPTAGRPAGGAENSPAVAVSRTDPSLLAVASRVDLPVASCAVRVSHDGGATWAEVPLPVAAGRQVGCFSPDVAFGADGTLYVSYTSLGSVAASGTAPDAVWLVASGDGGRTFAPPHQASGPLAFHLRLAADPVVPRRLYLAWVQAAATSAWGFSAPGNPLQVSRSDDGGQTWSTPTTASSGGRRRPVAPALAVGRTGTVNIAFLDLGGDRLDYEGEHEGRGGRPFAGRWSLFVARSADRGRTWTEAAVDRGVVPGSRVLMLFPPRPVLVIDDARRRQYVGFSDARQGDAVVRVWASTDGHRWSGGRRVDGTASRDGRLQHLPQLALAPDGRLDVVYYEGRAGPTGERDDVSLQSSYDGGRTFTARRRLSDRPFDAGIGLGAERGLPELGDRLGLVATDRATLALWSDTRAGTSDAIRQDLARQVVAFGRPSGARRLWRAAAVGAVLLGAGVAGLAITGRRRRRAGAAPPGVPDS